MAKSTVKILEKFRADLIEDHIKRSGVQDPSSQEITYLGANHSRLQYEIFTAIKLLTNEGNDEKAIKERNQ